MLSLDPMSLVASGLVGMGGFALLIYGKRTSQFLHMMGGLAMMVFPYFVPNPFLTLGIGAGIVGAVWFLGR